MRKLLVSIECRGRQVQAGFLTGDSPEEARFRYSDTYLENSMTPISISLPLKEDTFSAAETAAFFDGLLPEGFTRRTVAKWLHADERDYLSILHDLGRECLGAVCITEEGEEPGASYERISEEQVRKLAAEGAVRSAEMVTKAHLSLTGASGKAGLYYDAPNDAWYLPRGTAPSTHIVKQSHVRLEAIVTNEMLSLLTAARCGIPTAENFIVNMGKGRDPDVLFAARRYDRQLGPDNPKIDGLPRPFRLHQEDFAQAMGIPASAKYEKEPGDYLGRMFDILRTYSADPVTDQLALWSTLVFDYLIGNTDAHIKNFSLLYGSDLKTIRLAPAYDIVSTAVYKESTRDMAFHIGGVSSLDEITRDSFRLAASEAGIGERMAMRCFDVMAGKFRQALGESTKELADAGFGKAEEIEKRILKTGGIHTIE